jgi:hypothetical protein
MVWNPIAEWEADWPAANRRLGELIGKDIAKTITPEEAVELAALQAFADYYIGKKTPRPTEVLDQVERASAHGHNMANYGKTPISQPAPDAGCD